jgi:hypothetical protein
MGGTCSTHEADEKCTKNYLVKLKEKGYMSDLTENVRISKVQLIEEGSEDAHCACPASGPPEVGALVNMVMKSEFHRKQEIRVYRLAMRLLAF